MIGAGEWILHNDAEFISLCLLPREVYRCKSRSSDDPKDRLQPLFHLEEVHVIIGSSGKPRQQRQRERHKTTDVHVRYNSWYISLPSSEKQQREMTTFCVSGERDHNR